MSVDYRAKLILGYKITEEQYNYIEEHYDIVQEARAKYNCAIDTWCVMEHSYFFGVQLASLDLEYDEYVEPIYVDDYDEEDYDEEDCILYDEISQYLLIAIRIESDKLFFCVEKIFTDDEQTACENVKEVSISSLVCNYDDEAVVRALEAYVRLLSDETKSSEFWKI